MLHAHCNNHELYACTSNLKKMSNIDVGQSKNIIFQKTKTVTRRCFMKPLLLNILHKWQENICAGGFFNKVVSTRPLTSFKQTPVQMFFCEFCKVFKNTYFVELLKNLVIIGDFLYFISWKKNLWNSLKGLHNLCTSS